MKLNKLLPIFGSLCVGITTMPFVVSCQKTPQMFIGSDWNNEVNGLVTETISVETHVEYLTTFDFQAWGGKGSEILPPPSLVLKIEGYVADTAITTGLKINGEWAPEGVLGDWNNGIARINHQFEKTDTCEFSIEFRNALTSSATFKLCAPDQVK